MKHVAINLLAILALYAALACWLVGCAPASHVPNSIPAVGSSIDQSRAHVESAENAVQAAKPHADPTGKAVLDLATKEHGAAQGTLLEARNELQQVQTERDQLSKQAATAQARADKLEHSWGHRLQVFVTWAFWILAGVVVLHVVGAALALFVPGPVGFFAGIVSRVVNPLGWGTWLVSHAVSTAALRQATAPLFVVPK